MNNLSKFFAALFLAVLAVGVSAPSIASKARQTNYHISNINDDGNYEVTTSGSCSSVPQRACQFSTDLSPDQPDGTYSPAYLSANGVTVMQGTYNP